MLNSPLKSGTYYPTKEQAVAQRSWVLVDAKDQLLGRLASEIAGILRGKNKTCFTPHQDCGDFVVVVNAADIKLSGNKEAQKNYYSHSGYVGGISKKSVSDLRASKPEQIITKAVKGMLPRNDLARKQLDKMKVYPGPDHPHAAQLASK